MLRFDQGIGDAHLKDINIGDEATQHRSALELSHPIQNGVVNNWEDMEAVWDHTFSKLGVQPSEHKVVQTEAAMNPKANRERVLQVMFEKYGFAAVNVSVQAILALNSQGLNTGFVVDSGDGVTHLVPITEGFLEPMLVQRVNLAGRHVTDQLMKLLRGQGHALNSTADFETVREIKQRLCYVALDVEAERRVARDTTIVEEQYVLPDSRVIRVGSERFMAPEILFNPALYGMDVEGLPKMIFDTIRKSEIDVQRNYFSHIVLSGGSTLYPGMSSRLERDLKQMYLDRVLGGDRDRAKRYPIKVEDPPLRQHMVFRGASMMAEAHESQGPNSKWWVTRKEYDEQGAACVHRLIPTKLH